MASRSTQKAAAAVTALAGGLYLNHHYGLYNDLRVHMRTKDSRKLLEKRIADLGDNMSSYNMLLQADQNAEALWFEGRTWTYAQLKLDVDKLTTIFEQQGISDRDSVAVFATNSPEMVIAFIALTRIGAVPALINTSLRSQTLNHCLNVAKAKIIISTPDLVPAILDLFQESSTSTPCLTINLSSFPPLSLPDSNQSQQLRQIRYEDLSAVAPSTSSLPKRTIFDPAMLIYTSGTSGKPKAVNIKHILTVVTSTPLTADINNKSYYYPLRTYACLPLYHATCLLTGLFYSFGTSGALCLARKFSASKFSADLVASRATRMLYVGELCRYLLQAPPSPDDKAHKCIVASGNGLAKDVWLKFQDRFNIPEIREFYRSTEGIAGFANFNNGRRGAGYAGFQGPVQRYFEETTFLVRYDPETEQPWRDPSTGFCRTVANNEPGEAIGKITTMATYHEYLDNPKANDEKIIRDVFVKGDKYQRTGDLLVRNSNGFISFLDRTGDTYRWRGENVAAGEVREHISRLPEVIDCSVYAVKLPAYDGQAGAVGLTLQNEDTNEEEKFMTVLYQRLRKGGLTVWQLPRLIRVTKQIDTGATFKHAKEVLKKRTWSPDANTDGDRLYWLDGEKYSKLEIGNWLDIEAGKARL